MYMQGREEEVEETEKEEKTLRSPEGGVGVCEGPQTPLSGWELTGLWRGGWP